MGAFIANFTKFYLKRTKSYVGQSWYKLFNTPAIKAIMLDQHKNTDYSMYIKALAQNKDEIVKNLPSEFSSLFISTFFTELHGCVFFT